MSDLREAAQQALEALKLSVPTTRAGEDEYAEEGWKEHNAAMVALKAALVEPQEPVGWFESPHGDFRANPLYKMKFPSTLLAWQIPLFIAPPQRPTEPAQTLVTALKDVLTSLVAAHSLLERGGKRAAWSDTVFSMMLDDCAQSIERGRAVLLKHVGG